MPRAKSRGFTIIEIILVIGIMTILAGFAVSATVRFYRNRELEVSADTLVSYLRAAEARALRSEGDASHGVSVAGDALTLFRGTTYATRVTAYDTVRTTQDYVGITGLSEVVFAKQTGAPTTTGAYTLTNGVRTVVVEVYPSGTVEKR